MAQLVSHWITREKYWITIKHPVSYEYSSHTALQYNQIQLYVDSLVGPSPIIFNPRI